MNAVTYSELPNMLVSTTSGPGRHRRGRLTRNQPRGTSGLVYTRSPESRPAGERALRRVFARTENRDQPLPLCAGGYERGLPQQDTHRETVGGCARLQLEGVAP